MNITHDQLATAFGKWIQDRINIPEKYADDRNLNVDEYANASATHLMKLLDEGSGLHDWKCISPGIYDSTYECQKCNDRFVDQADNPDKGRPVVGCTGPTTSYERVVSGKTWPHDGATVEVTFPAGYRPGDITRKATYDKETHTFMLEPTELTEREKWLMEQAYSSGMSAVSCQMPFNYWLTDAAEGGITVEMVLIKDAPQ